MKPGKEGHLIGGLSFFMDSIHHFTALPASDWRIFILVLPAVGADKRLPLRLYSGGEKTAKAVR
ncbi:hypothetical protein NX016_19170 [Klebsiella pneumoniae]|nr:hypothetical protein [Klebsiella pneumoniae]MDV3424232.1 hypothetical protein [Klebsiella pneumoniae]